MTIPNVTMTWCHRQAICGWCEEPIEAEKPMVKVFWWNKGNDKLRKWNSQKCFHPNCWILQGLDYLAKNPFTSARTTKLAKLSKEDKERRFVLVRQFHALGQRKQKIKASYPDRLLIETRIDKQMVDVMLDVAKLGGIPKKWAEKFV